VQLVDGRWLNGQFLSLRPSSYFISRLVLAEVILFALVLAVTLTLAMRFARPMQELASASERIGADRSASPIAERGPPDIRAAIHSFNAMTKRVSDLLREKDGMLGAIGHDLRTPLASLRIRAESVEPLSERRKIIETLDDMSLMVDEILDLARLGHSGEPFVPVDIAALADAVVEEFRDLGKNATFVDAPRTVLRVQPLLTKRLLRNLVENAIKFADSARVSIEATERTVALCVADDGPGIGPEALERVFEPFYRLENSRSRTTGGAGLGLSIAQGIARNQGAELVLENGHSKGLVARVVWPRPVAEKAA
jgi:signal transduction histidine kinase